MSDVREEQADALATIEHVRAELARAAEQLTRQLERTGSVYGDRLQWPASSEMHVREIEEHLARVGARLVDVLAYAREIGAVAVTR